MTNPIHSDPQVRAAVVSLCERICRMIGSVRADSSTPAVVFPSDFDEVLDACAAARNEGQEPWRWIILDKNGAPDAELFRTQASADAECLRLNAGSANIGGLSRPFTVAALFRAAPDARPSPTRQQVKEITLRNRDACGYNCDCHDELMPLFPESRTEHNNG